MVRKTKEFFHDIRRIFADRRRASPDMSGMIPDTGQARDSGIDLDSYEMCRPSSGKRL
jgi:hypothetical protein